MNTYTDSRLITLSGDTADIVNNGTLLSSCVFNFPSMLQDEQDILYTQISVQNAQIPISFYTCNIYNHTLTYKLGAGAVQSVSFDVGNYSASTFAIEFHNKIPDLTLTFNRTNGKFTITGTTYFTLYHSSTCFRLLGLDVKTDYFSSNLACPFPCQFQGITRIKIISDTLSTYSMDSNTGNFSNVLASLSVNSASYGILLYQNTSQFKPILREKTINSFDISLLDDFDNLINFNNVSWNITLQLDIVRKLDISDKSFPVPEAPPASAIPEINNIIEDIPETGDNDLDLLMYQSGIYQ